MTGIEEIALALGASAATASAVGTAATVASVGASVASGLVGAVGAINAGHAQAAALDANAQVQRTNAGTALSTSEADAARLQDRTRRAVATSTNAYAGSGIDATQGSPLDVLADQAGQGALDSEIARWRGATQANSYLTSSVNLGAQADQAASAGYVTAGSTLLTSALRTATALSPRNANPTSASDTSAPSFSRTTSGRVAGPL